IGLLAGLFVLTFVDMHSSVYWGLDLDGTVWSAGAAILDGRSPYPAPDPAALADALNPAVYPAGVLVALTPLSLLPFDAAFALWGLANAAALVVALRLVGVRDWRCLAIASLCAPAAVSLVVGQLNGLLALGVALVWRHRAHARRAGAAVGLIVAAKVFLWP